MRQVAQMALMAAIVGLAGVPLDHLLTFGGALGRYAGMFAWWLAFFVLALVYAGFAFPWDETQGFTEE
jgi:hypothetical protein